MSETISCLHSIALRGSDYIVIVVRESGYDTELQKALDRHITKFHERVGKRVRVARSYERSSNETFRELKAKAWPAEILRRMDDAQSCPFLVFIKQDFDAFDPDRHDWAIMWLPALGSPANRIPYALQRIEQELQRAQNLFDYFRSKSVGIDHSFPSTSVSARGVVSEQATPKSGGRKRICSLEQAQKLMAMLRIQTTDAGWQDALIKAAHKQCLKTDGTRYPRKSVRDAFVEFGYFDAIENGMRAK